MSSTRRMAYGVMLGAFAGPTVPDWLPGAYAHGLAGVCLYGNNMARDTEIADLARAVRDIDPSAVLALDEEGGDVTRLHAREGSPYPGNAALGAYDDATATQAIAAGIGAELARAGIWLDLAPSADINSNPRNPVIGTRSFGADPELVARHTSAYVSGLASQGVAASVKHFPGHGDTSADSHLGLPRVAAPADVLRARELVPFTAVLDDAATIMTSHVLLEAFDDQEPATLSRAVLTGLLRDELGFGGVIVTDALDMAGASAVHGIGGAAVLSLAAGADLLCLGPEQTSSPHTIEQAVDAVCRAVESGDLPLARLTEAAKRVGALRETWSGIAVRDDADEVIAAARQASAHVATGLIAGAPRLDGPATVVRIDTGTNLAVGDTAWGELDLGGCRLDLTADDLPAQTPLDGQVAIVVRRAAAAPAVWAWIQVQLAANPSTVLVELGWPDPALDAYDRVVRTYGSAAVLTDALASAMRGGR
ncbi:glycoside hydrolase family 3 protein [Aeromicrobium ginsengisoli]|uniref:Glycoside hydrolase family 3 protein n=1 Tax=Aeromicrobium ginsengisoli TaxID=363867 RepID=A0A5M4FGV3_9ACTN|nr:glycoside hydrolase family 3 N-terminal domain-containing protein [Aeromicrobium ginsengisoli]KAA1398013.1 glycoside hydrolase family 3 protein [Aeromicrobium ginsengisoli]